jgi:hypothetical protein
MFKYRGLSKEGYKNVHISIKASVLETLSNNIYVEDQLHTFLTEVRFKCTEYNTHIQIFLSGN